MLRATTDPKTGQTTASLTDTQRGQLARAKSLCYELSQFVEDPRYEAAGEAIGHLSVLLSRTHTMQDKPDETDIADD